MKFRRRIATYYAFSSLLLATLFNGCSTPFWRSGKRRDTHAFIGPWTPPDGSNRLRLAVKDNIDVKGVVTTAGSEYISKTNPPAAKDASCLAIARQRNVQIVGKANMSEFAVAPSGINEYYGTPRNPYNGWFKKFIPGGSSSGSAEAVASGMADVALGTDTAGSIRVPSACCGVVGLKTTFGLVPLDGIFPIDPRHLDTVGPMGKDIAHVVQGMDLLQNNFAARYQAAVAAKPSAGDITIGRLTLKGTDSKIDKAVDDALARAGFRVVPLDDEFRTKWEQAKEDGNTLAAAGAWMSDKQYADKTGVSLRTKSVILLGGILYKTKYQQALARRAEWQRTLDGVLKKVDFIALPTMQTKPPYIPPSLKIGILEALVLNAQNTVPVNLAGNPALAAPIPFHPKAVPTASLQLIGPRLGEAALLNAGRLIEAAQ